MKMKIRNALTEDFEFILDLTRRNMERIVTEEWNADWEKDIEPNFVKLWEMQGEKKIIEVDNRRVGYFWFEQHPEKKEIFINSIQIVEQFQRKGVGTEVIDGLLKEAMNHNLEFIRGMVQKTNIHAKKFFEKSRFKFIEETKSGILIERGLKENTR
ncbi:MAG: GNAT family N-acetyltransferase [Methanophagales archaeon]|nr:GNAT family N-acetyltransferase [Methanophagales archaeon]